MPPNNPAQVRRAVGVRLLTESLTRRRLEPAGWVADWKSGNSWASTILCRSPEEQEQRRVNYGQCRHLDKKPGEIQVGCGKGAPIRGEFDAPN